MVALTVLVVTLRYAFNQGSILLQEAVMYLHALVFMLGIPYALKQNAHVRVDVLHGRLSDRGRAMVDLLGHLLFLAPVSLTIVVYSYGYVMNSWYILERSSEVGGIPGVFLLKTLIPLTALLLLLQGLAESLRCLRRLRHAHA
jgi:TRAP-type mannitol/chloroaromatic compound transport system permease small subunit